MHDPILQFRQLGIIPTVGGANQITGYALQTVNVVAMAVRALCKILLSIFISTVHTSVSVMVH